MTPKTCKRAGALGGLALGAFLVARFTAFAPAETPYSRGAALVEEHGCMSCHAGGTANPSLHAEVSDGTVPPLVGCELDADDFAALVMDGGTPALLASARWQKATGALALRMPSFSGHLSHKDVGDIRAWAQISDRAEGRPGLDAGNPLARAEALAEAWGCFACHGELGQGGVRNPGALTAEIPALVGDDFEHLTDGADPEVIAEWIREGVSERFLSGNPLAPIGRFFMARQCTQMQAYDGALSDEELQLLVSYCLHLHEIGPMDAQAYSDYRASLRSGTLSGGPPTDTTDSRESPGFLPPVIAALFSEACVRCHGPKKQESDYRMDTAAAAFSLGEIADYLGVKNIVPGDAEASLLFTFVAATEEDPENELFPMPPDEKERLTTEQINLIREWITNGAPWDNSQELTSTYSD